MTVHLFLPTQCSRAPCRERALRKSKHARDHHNTNAATKNPRSETALPAYSVDASLVPLVPPPCVKLLEPPVGELPGADEADPPPLPFPEPPICCAPPPERPGTL